MPTKERLKQNIKTKVNGSKLWVLGFINLGIRMVKLNSNLV